MDTLRPPTESAVSAIAEKLHHAAGIARTHAEVAEKLYQAAGIALAHLGHPVPSDPITRCDALGLAVESHITEQAAQRRADIERIRLLEHELAETT